MQPPLQLEKYYRSDESISVEQRLEMHPQSFYVMYGKRILDVFLSATGILVLCPLFVLVAFSIKLTSRGAVFYRQVRVGKNGKQFSLLKFRSMHLPACLADPGITVFGDQRVTSVGRLLRRYKLDELPQLWNVLRGDMSLVGPRPELPKYVEVYSLEQRKVLGVQPGITDPASIKYRNEESLLASFEDPEHAYLTRLLPEKLALNLQYIRQISFFDDLQLIFTTVKRSLLPGDSSRN